MLPVSPLLEALIEVFAGPSWPGRAQRLRRRSFTTG
jgi:hypothetical protein